MTSRKLICSLRQATPLDEPLILSSWLKSAYNLCPAFKDMPKSLYFGLHEPAVKLSLATSDTLLAVDSEDPTHILGYLVYKNYPFFSVIHYIYVKQQFRGFKIAAHLLEEADLRQYIFTSHETFDSQRFFNSKQLPTFHVPHFRHGEWHEAQVNLFLSSRKDRP